MTEDDVERLANDAMQRQDYETAMNLLSSLADKDSNYALEALAWIYANGPPHLVNKDLARKFYERLVAKGSVEGHLEFGWHLIAQRNFIEARAILERGKAIGGGEFDEAIEKLTHYEAELAAYKAIEARDYWQAFTLLDGQRRCRSAYTLATLGWLYEMGLGVASDPSLARILYHQASELGDLDACYRLGRLELEDGNSEAARAEFSRGALKGHLASTSKLAEMMVEGVGGPIDLEQGMRLLSKVAAEGHIASKIKILKLEVKTTKNIFGKILVWLKHLPKIIFAALDSSKPEYSQTHFEFLGPSSPSR
ncbi:MAG: tetratricopeptide repeat protein [Aquidulcibacter sp.]|uniref:tetratricopeptide repeat protein n=1 Tax=Aquidulcibacter sp. TaxID=2052990 RepID=UPI0022CC1A0C|nr:tetratricopeptide repeat protein [Aquidulcibacter sp.]MCE2891520.1 sel1 repeat family protein [Hyphomonadaceae bacterium]MCZ8208961.1 tetratricopeptide repeat protein [Aquidulcibacter sp.]